MYRSSAGGLEGNAVAERFYKLPQDLAARTDLTATAKIVFAVIRDHFGENVGSWPGRPRLSRLCGVTLNSIVKAVADLKAAGLLAVEKRRSGQSNLYTLPQSVPETGTVLESTGNQNRTRNCTGGVPETGTEPYQKLHPNQTDSSNQTGERPSAARSETPKTAKRPKTPKADTNRNGAGGRLVTLWAEGSKTRGIVFGDRGKVSGLLASMLAAGRTEADLSAAVGRWWGADRGDYGFPLFKARLDGGNRELTGRAAVPDLATMKRSAYEAAALKEAMGEN
jgi:hypothetical protein